MVAPVVTLLNENKPNQSGIDPGHPGNSFVISPRQSLLVNPNYGKLINRGSDTNYSINVNYSTNLTHPELAPQNPVQNPVLEGTKTLNPVQEISIVGKGTDPNVSIGGSHVSHYVRVKEEPTRTQTTNQTTNLTPQEVLGPFAKAFNGKDINQVLQITGGLTLPELFNILNQYGININNWKNANLTINGNKIIIEYTSFNSIWIMTYESKNILEIENKDGLIIVKHKNYQIDRWVDSSGPHKETNLISDSYYIIDPKLGELIYQGSGSIKSILPELSTIKILGPIMNRYLNYDPNSFAQQVLQITNGLTLPELFKILGQSESFWTPTYSNSTFPNGSSVNVANVEISGNKITFSNQSQLNESLPHAGSYNNQVVNTLTIEPYNVTQNGKTYHLVLVEQQQYTYNNFEGNVTQDTLTWYYIVDPITKKIIYQAQEPPQQTQYQLSNPQSGNIVSPSQTISSVLQQYGYALPSQELQEINNLQPGQSITANASAGSSGAQFKVTYLGNGQYQIQSVSRFYNFNDFSNPWTSINETVTVPTYSINQQTGQISTTNLSISGQVTTYGTTNINEPYYNATYNVNETIPINYMYNTQTRQLTFWGGNPQGGITLQNISAPTLTYQEYIQLANGKMPKGVTPYTWYYYPTLHEWVYVTPPQYTLNVGNTKITNQEVIGFVQQYGNNNVLITNLGMTGNPNELAFIYVTPNGNGEMLIYNTSTGQVIDKVPIKNLQTGNSDYDLMVQMIYNQQYKTYSNEIITFNLNNTNSSSSTTTSSTPTYLTVDLINNNIYLQNSNGQIISSKTFNNQQDLLTYLDNTYGITPYNVLMAEYPPLVTNANTSSQTIFNPSVIQNITSNNTSSSQYIIPGTTMTAPNNTSSININWSTIWNNVGNTLYNAFETLFGWGSPSTPQTPSYITGVMTSPIQLPKKYLYQGELENIQFEAQEIEQSPITYYSGAQGGAYLFGTLAQYSAGISQTLSNWGLQQPSQFFLNVAQSFLNLEQQSQIVGTPANIFGSTLTIAKPLASIALIEYFGPGEEATSATTTTAMPTLGDFAKSFIIQGSAITGLTNAISYFTTGKLLSPEEDIFLFTTAGLTAAGTSALGSMLSKGLTDVGIVGLKNTILTDLTQSVISQAGINTEVQEAFSLQNSGKWLSPSEAKQAAASGAEMGLFFVPVDLFMSRFSSGFLGNPLFSSLTAGTTNALFMLPSGNPELVASAFGIGFITHGLDRMFEFSQIPYLLESPEAQRVLDTTEAGWRLEGELKDKMVEAGLVSKDDTLGWTTTQTIQKLTEIYNDLQEKIIEKELSPQDKTYLKLNRILGIRDDIIQGEEEAFAKYVRDKVLDGEKYYQAQQILKDLGKKLDKIFYGFKVNLNLGNNQHTLFYFMRSGDEYKLGFGSAGKEESFIGRRSVSDVTLNVAGIYNTPSDVIDTIKYLRSKGMYDDAEMLERIYRATRSIKDILTKIKPSKNIEIEFRDYAEEYAKKYGLQYGELISTQMGDTIKEYIQENFGEDAVIYGSESVRQYLDNIAKMYGGEVVRVGKYYAVIDRYGNTIWKFRMPGDVDVIINTRDPGVLEKAAEDIAKLLNKTLRTNRFVAQDHLVIDKYRGGEHVVDLHMPNEGSEWKNVYARLSNFNDLGFPRPEPARTDNLRVARLSQTLLDKASAVATLRQLSLSDLVDDINSGAKIDNPDYVTSFLKNLLKDADYETQRNVLSEFIANLNPGNRNLYIYLISKEFGIPIEDLTYVDPRYLKVVENYFYKKQTYLAPATYRLKDTGDTLSLTYLGGKLADSIYKRIPGIDRNVMKDYERIKQISKGKGILEKDWTEPNEINMEDIYKMLNPFESNTESPRMVRVGSVIGSIGSLFESKSGITQPSAISSISSSSSESNSPSILTSVSLSTSRSALTSMSSSIVSASESLSSSLTSSSLSGSISSSLSNSASLSPSISASISSSLSSSLSQSSSLSSSLSTSMSTSTSTSTSTSESISASVSTSSPGQFAFLGIGKPKHESSAMQPKLGKAKTSMSDVAYAFYRIWR